MFVCLVSAHHFSSVVLMCSGLVVLQCLEGVENDVSLQLGIEVFTGYFLLTLRLKC